MNSFDIVMAWLYDYIAQRTKKFIVNQPFWQYGSKIQPFWKNYEQIEWKLHKDPDVMCALENYDTVPALPWEHLMDRINQSDKMNVMADYFMTCRVKTGCVFENPDWEVDILSNYSDVIVRIPSPEQCTHTCNDLPDDPTYPYEPSSYKYYAYTYAYMTTHVGHNMHCYYNNTDIYQNEVRVECHPRIFDKYITKRQYDNCKSNGCKKACCKPLRPPEHPHCEIVIDQTPSVSNRNKTYIVDTVNLDPYVYKDE